jgi:hypothetical protein
MTSKDTRAVSCRQYEPCWIVIVAIIVTFLPSISHAQAIAPQSPPDQPTPPQYKETIEVVGATPIHGLGIRRSKIPNNVQSATAADLTPGIHFGDQLTAGFANVHVNEAQNNPFQPDIQFRGFAASPLLGLPQGVAIYQDGVRMNEPFGDPVNWTCCRRMPSRA